MADNLGLNFTQGTFVDPFASVQASIGAGGMFAKTLNDLHQYDLEDLRFQALRTEEERRKKVDAEHSEDRMLAKQALAEAKAKESAELGLVKDINSMHLAGSHIGDAAGANADIADITKSGVATKNLQGNQEYLQSSLAKLQEKGIGAGDDVYDGVAYRLNNYNPNENLDLHNEVIFDRKLQSKLGKNDADSIIATDNRFGLTSAQSSDITKRESLSDNFNHQYETMTNSPAYQKLQSSVIGDYIAKIEKNGGIVTKDMYLAYGKAKDSDYEAYANAKTKLETLQAKASADESLLQDKQYANNLKMLELQVSALNPSHISSRSSSTNSNTQKDYSTDALNMLSDTIDRIPGASNGNNVDAVNNARVLGANMIKNGAGLAQIKEKIRQSLTGVNEGEGKDAFFKLTYNTPEGAYNLRASNEEMARYNSSGSDSKQYDLYKKNIADNQAILKQMSKGGLETANAAIALDKKRIADAERSPDKAMTDNAAVEWNRWAIENGLPHATKENNAAIKALQKQTVVTPAGSGSTGKLQGVAASSTNKVNPAFDIPGASDAQRLGTPEGQKKASDMAFKQTVGLINSREGFKPGIYNVPTLLENGTTIQVPHIGHGVKIATLASANNISVKAFTDGYNSKDKATHDKYASMAVNTEEKLHRQAYDQANKMAIEANLSLEAVPVLASTIYNLGPKWADKDNPRGFYNRWELIKQGKLKEAAAGLDKSVWSKQAKGRPEDFVAMLNDQMARKGTKYYNPKAESIAIPKAMSDADYEAHADSLKKGYTPTKILESNTASLKSQISTMAKELNDIGKEHNANSYLTTSPSEFKTKLSLSDAYDGKSNEIAKLQAQVAMNDAKKNLVKFDEQHPNKNLSAVDESKRDRLLRIVDDINEDINYANIKIAERKIKGNFRY